MGISDVLLICATVAGPIFAVQAQRIVDRLRAAKDRRLEIFKALMSTRDTLLSPRHVEALNLIDIEFRDERFHSVRAAWRRYLVHLREPVLLTDPAIFATWKQKRDELRAELLKEMGDALGYRFDSVDILKGHYSPDEVVQMQQAEQLIRLRGVTFLDLATKVLEAARSAPAPLPQASDQTKKIEEHRG